ncbi:ERG2/sigma1 receptor-like protein [Pilobolus umbonatus]|nr:ERG2/sigma1 receptor-like protein [Pilobolus umbonatus]
MSAVACANSSKSCLTKLFFLLSICIAIFLGVDSIKERYFIFDQNILQSVAQENIAKYSESGNTRAMLENIAADLQKEYPGHITTKEEWVFNNAGGAMGSMWILHASIFEYVIIFGTPVGTEGHTGRYFADDYFIILEGEQWAYKAGELSREVYKPGEMHHLPRGHAQQYKIPEHAWALEYAQGWIPLMLPFGFADTFFSTLDFFTLYDTLRITGKAIISELLKGKL